MSTNAVLIDEESASHPAPQHDPTVDALEERIARTERRRVDVTELDVTSLETFVEENVGTHLVSLEHRGGRTYLVLE